MFHRQQCFCHLSMYICSCSFLMQLHIIASSVAWHSETLHVCVLKQSPQNKPDNTKVSDFTYRRVVSFHVHVCYFMFATKLLFDHCSWAFSSYLYCRHWNSSSETQTMIFQSLILKTRWKTKIFYRNFTFVHIYSLSWV